MKKGLILVAITSIGFLSASVLPSLPEKNNENLKKDLIISIVENKLEYCKFSNSQANLSLKKDDSPTCTVSCSVTTSAFGTNLTISTTAGGWFTSCETATLNCNKKLMHKIVDLTL